MGSVASSVLDTGALRCQGSPPNVESPNEAEVLSAQIEALRWEISRAEEELAESRAQAQAVRAANQVNAERLERLRSEVAAQDWDWNAEAALRREESDRRRRVASYSSQVDQLQGELIAIVEARSPIEVRLSRLVADAMATRDARGRELQVQSVPPSSPPAPLRAVSQSSPPLRPRLSGLGSTAANIAAACQRDS